MAFQRSNPPAPEESIAAEGMEKSVAPASNQWWRWGRGTIRNRLLLAFILIVVLVAVFVSASSIFISLQFGRQQAVNQLEVIATLKETKLETWTRDLQANLTTFLIEGETLISIRALLGPATFRELYEERLLETFEQTTKLTGQFDELFLMDPDGQVVMSSDPAQKGTDHSQENYFRKGVEGSYLEPPFYSPELDQVSLVVVHPVFSVKGHFLGVLAGRANIAKLNEIMQEQSGLSQTYLVDANNRLLTPLSREEYPTGKTIINSEGVNTALAAQNNGRVEGPELYNDFRGIPVIGVYHWLPELQMALLVEQAQSEAFAPIFAIIRSNVILALVAAIFAIGVGLLITRSIANPLANLVRTARQIAAGDLRQRATVERQDEIGELAQAFNLMTSQLQTLIDNLEDRVLNRTRRLESVATLGERLTALLDFDELLNELVNQVKKTFDYYHAHVYILDEQQQNLVMVAGVGQAGAEMKAKGHAIALDARSSLVARAARRGEVVSVANVREAEDWLPNPLLPDTYSEMAVPIILEGQVVGVLDVQQDEVAGLDEGDENLLRSLANQVAIAIRNARLFKQIETALAETRAAQEQYLEQGWDKSKFAPRQSQYLYARPEAAPLDEAKQQALAAARQQAVAQPMVVTLNDDDFEAKSLVAPINLGKKKIGTVQLHTSDNKQAWSEDDLAIIEAVADQLAQTAENLRLFEETQNRASREQAIREITDKLRASSNLGALLETAARELGQRLGARHTVLELGIEPELVQNNSKKSN